MFLSVIQGNMVLEIDYKVTKQRLILKLKKYIYLALVVEERLRNKVGRIQVMEEQDI